MSSRPLGCHHKLNVWIILLQEMTRPDLTVSINRLLLFVGEERARTEGIHRAVHDIESEMDQGLPPMYYRDIPYMPVYAAAGDEIQFGLVLANGQVGAAHHWVP